MAFLGLSGTAWAIGAAIASAATAAGTSASQQHQNRKAQKTAQKRESKAQADAAAATPGMAQQRDNSLASTNEHLRGIQSTMLASREAQNAGNSTLGS